MTRFVAVVALVALAASCAHSGGSKPDPKSVRVLNAPPEEPYEVIGTVTAKEDDLDEAMEELQKQAADLRGDAVIVILQAATDRRLFRKAKVQLAADVIRFERTPAPAETKPAK